MSEASISPEAEILFGDIIEYIDAAQELLASNRIDSLAQLDEAVEELALRVAALPADIITSYQPEMEFVAEQMRNLTAAMLQKSSGMAHELQMVEKRLKAIRAYHVTPSEGE